MNFKLIIRLPSLVNLRAPTVFRSKGIIANPNCAAITALVPLWPIHQTNRIKRGHKNHDVKCTTRVYV
ncbi:hypothetical protein [Bradyrhizobium sp. RT9a]|uniref:hypothetical protein n=1 Tax=Bradyrhizobium sp. RT9a TaxID=3156384 RepID=UPI003397049A